MLKETPFGKLEIFDAHTHFFSYNFFNLLAGQSEKLQKSDNPVEEIGEITGFQMPPADTGKFAEIWKEELDKNSVSKALLMASLPGDEPTVSKALKIFPEKFAGAFFFNPLIENAVARAEKNFDELNLQVICLFPAMHGFSVGDNENVKAIAELVSKRKGTAIFVHCGALSIGIRGKIGLPSKFDLRLSSPLEVHKLASEFPDVNFIIPHFGAGFWRETLMTAELCPNVYIDTSSSNKWIKYLPVDLTLETVFRRTLEVVGSERLLFGTDSSFFPRGWNTEVFNEQIRIFSNIKIGQDDAKEILGGNLNRILAG